MTKRPDGITLITIYYLVTGVLSLVGALYAIVSGMLNPDFLQQGCGLIRLISFPFALAALGSSGILYGLLAVTTGWGLINYYAWARWIAIILAALGLLNFPVGTVIGAVIIWYLLKRDISCLFR